MSSSQHHLPSDGPSDAKATGRGYKGSYSLKEATDTPGGPGHWQVWGAQALAAPRQTTLSPTTVFGSEGRAAPGVNARPQGSGASPGESQYHQAGWKRQQSQPRCEVAMTCVSWDAENCPPPPGLGQAPQQLRPAQTRCLGLPPTPTHPLRLKGVSAVQCPTGTNLASAFRSLQAWFQCVLQDCGEWSGPCVFS